MSSYWDWLATRERAAPPREPEMRSYTPSLAERFKYALQDGMMALGAKPYSAGKMAESLRDVVSLLPPVGVPFAADEMQRAAKRGDIASTTFAALGATPAGRLPRRVAFATHEAVPGVGTGHLPGFAGAGDDIRAAYSADSRSTWALAPKGGDEIHSSRGVLPTLEMQGRYLAPNGVTELNPGWAARPFIDIDSVRAQRLSDADRKWLRAGEAVRAYGDAQQAGAFHKVWFDSPTSNSNSLFLRKDGKSTPEQLDGLKAIGDRYGLPDIVDTGQGVTMTRWGPPPADISDALRKGSLREDIQSTVPAAQLFRTNVEGDLVDFSDAWAAGAGSGAATRQMLKEVNGLPEIRATLEGDPLIAQKFLGNLERDEEWALRLGATRADIQDARRIVGQGPGWISRLEEALKKGALLPALAAALLQDEATAPTSRP